MDCQPRLLSVIWESTAACLENAIVPVKMCALDVATRLLRLQGLPEAHLADNFVSVVFDLLYYLLENLSEDIDDEFRQELSDMEVNPYFALGFVRKGEPVLVSFLIKLPSHNMQIDFLSILSLSSCPTDSSGVLFRSVHSNPSPRNPIHFHRSFRFPKVFFVLSQIDRRVHSYESLRPFALHFVDERVEVFHLSSPRRHFRL